MPPLVFAGKEFLRAIVTKGYSALNIGNYDRVQDCGYVVRRRE